MIFEDPKLMILHYCTNCQVGDATRTCGEDKQWSGVEPKCKEINCGSPGRLPNGWLEGARMNLGDVVNFKCVDGMKFEGESLSTTCQVTSP